jgi:hypothetical protein
MDPDPDPPIFVIDLKRPTKSNLKKSLSAYYFLKIKNPKEVTKQ